MISLVNGAEGPPVGTRTSHIAARDLCCEMLLILRGDQLSLVFVADSFTCHGTARHGGVVSRAARYESRLRNQPRRDCLAS